MPAVRPARLLRFGPFEADALTGEFRQDGRRIRLQEKPFRVLLALAERPGELVTREELRKLLWPEDTFVDFETGLNTAVSKLRDALDDPADKPKYIETLPRRGYRFLAAVESADGPTLASGAARVAGAPPAGVEPALLTTLESPTNGSQPAASPTAAAVPRAKRFALCAFAAALILAIAFTFWWLTPLPDPKIVQVFPVTSDGRQDFLVAPATDGVRLFYIQRSGDHYDTMEGPLTGGAARKIDAPFPNTLIWDVTRDGSRYLITSFRHRGEDSPLWSWPAAGGTPVKLGDLVSGSAAWSPDGDSVVYHFGNELWLANADGTGKQMLGNFQGQPDSPAWSPDGSRIRFTLKSAAPESLRIFEISRDGRNLHELFPNWSDANRICCGTWTPDGKYYVFTDGKPKISTLWASREKGDWLRRSPRGPFQIAAEPMGSWAPMMSRDGKHVYFYGNGRVTELQKLNPATGQFASFLPNTGAVMPSASRDGAWAAFVERSSPGVFRSRSDGSELHQFPIGDFSAAFPRWSPDGKSIVFGMTKPNSTPIVCVLSVADGEFHPLIDNAELFDPDWSPDGARIVVAHDFPRTEGGIRERLELVDVQTRQAEEIKGSENLALPRWSPDGKYIAAVDQSSSTLRIYEVTSGKWQNIAHGKGMSLPAWSANSQYIYFQDPYEFGEPLYRLELRTRRVETVATFDKVAASGVHRFTFQGLAADGSPIIGFDRGDSDIFGATVIFP